MNHQPMEDILAQHWPYVCGAWGFAVFVLAVLAFSTWRGWRHACRADNSEAPS